MKTTIRLTVALMAALAFTAARADDSKDSQCEEKDAPCASAMTQDGSSSSEESTSAGSGAGEPSAAQTSTDEGYRELVQHEIWESGG